MLKETTKEKCEGDCLQIDSFKIDLRKTQDFKNKSLQDDVPFSHLPLRGGKGGGRGEWKKTHITDRYLQSAGEKKI